MDCTPPSPSPSSNSSDSKRESDENSECSSISSEEEKRIQDFQRSVERIFRDFQGPKLIKKEEDEDEDEEEEDDDGADSSNFSPPHRGACVAEGEYGGGGYNDDNSYGDDDGYGDCEDHVSYDCDYNNNNNDDTEELHHGHQLSWENSYFDVGNGSGNYSYGRAYLDHLLDALTNHPDTVRVVDGSYFQVMDARCRSPKFLFRIFSNGKRLADLYVDLPPNALPPQTSIIDPRPCNSNSNSNSNSSTICPKCHRNRSFDDEEGEANEGGGNKEEREQDEEMKHCTVEEKKQQNQNTVPHHGNQEQQKQDTHKKGNDESSKDI